MESLPIIDLSPLRDLDDVAGRQKVAQAVDGACREVGFFLIAGHDVPMAALNRLDSAARRFFALPTDRKDEVSMRRGGRAWRGWFPEGNELTSGRPDHKEGLYLGTDLPAEDPRVRAGLPLHGPNLLPDLDVPELRPAADEWMKHMTNLGHLLTSLLAQGLGLPADWFRRHLTADPTVLFRIFRYPALPANHPSDQAGWSVGEHSDYGLITILAHDGRPGLQVRVGPNRWVEVRAEPDMFVVNIGDMLDRLTGGRYRSTPHRVMHTGTGDRLSFPFFFDPSWDAEIIAPPLTGAAPADDAGHRWDQTSVHEFSGTYGQYLSAKVAKVFPTLATKLLTPPRR